jgi:hypothetical protein
MPYDPKRIYEDRTPPTPKDAARGHRVSGIPHIAVAPGRCIQCGRPYETGDQVVSKSGSMPLPVLELREFWHRDCWHEAHGDHWI